MFIQRQKIVVDTCIQEPIQYIVVALQHAQQTEKSGFVAPLLKVFVSTEILLDLEDGCIFQVARLMWRMRDQVVDSFFDGLFGRCTRGAHDDADFVETDISR